MFDLKRPCVNCPFRKGQGSRFRLTLDRLLGVIGGVAFQCHKTVDYRDAEEGGPQPGDRPQQCAGLMAVLHRSGRDNQIMQIATRLGSLFPEELDPADEAYGSVEEATAAHLHGVEP